MAVPLDMLTLSSPIMKVIIPGVAIAVIALVVRVRGLTWKADVGTGDAHVSRGLVWMAAYLALMLISDALMHWRGPWDFSVWRTEPLSTSIFRVLGVCFLGPLAEELLFRGLLFSRLARMSSGTRKATLGTSALWSVLHYAYTPDVIALLFVAGVLLAMARLRTGAVWMPVAMHIMWNLYAVW